MRAAFLILSLSLFACSDSASTSPVSPDAGSGVDGSVASSCPPITGAGTEHDVVAADETWTTAASPHIIKASLSIPAGKTITVEPCAVVRLGGGMTVEGKLVALGDAAHTIRLYRTVDSAAWTSIETRKGAEVRLAYVSIDGGGGNSAPGTLDVRGDADAATQGILFVDHVSITKSESAGINVREGGGFTGGSNALTVSGSKSFPVSIWGRAAGTLPSGTYTGNATDEILLPAAGGRDDIQEDMTLSDRGVPYRVGTPDGLAASLGVQGASVPLLTIDAGVTLRFSKLGRLHVDGTNDVANGALRIAGTSERPVVLTSAEASPKAGDWVGIVLEGKPDPRTAIANAKISYAGADSQVSSFGCPNPDGSFSNDAAIVIAGGKPATAFVTQTTIAESAGQGIVRGWTGGEVDFLTTNTFTNVASCNQTFPKPEVGVCPNPAPCPK